MTAAHNTRHERLTAFIEDRRSAAFEWGANDCIMFAADAVLVQTGEDLAAEYRETYRTAGDAARLLKRLGGLEAVATKALGEPKPWPYAQIGDIVLVKLDDREHLAVCMGTHYAVPAPQRLAFWPMAGAVKAWSVPL